MSGAVKFKNTYIIIFASYTMLFQLVLSGLRTDISIVGVSQNWTYMHIDPIRSLDVNSLLRLFTKSCRIWYRIKKCLEIGTKSRLLFNMRWDSHFYILLNLVSITVKMFSNCSILELSSTLNNLSYDFNCENCIQFFCKAFSRPGLPVKPK